jgi:UDP-2,4-diacetamido-2,4,6-trideoxy-beta-L-altropyranose hydrolase
VTRIAIRADASVDIGTGHVMRCLALAEALHAQGAEIVFICREQEGDLCGLIASRDFEVLRLPRLPTGEALDWQLDAQQTARALAEKWPRTDWLIVDHYRLDERWEQSVRPVAARIMAIDDLADRRHDCELLVDQNLSRDMDNRYTGLVPESARLLLGPKHALLRTEFIAARAAGKRRDGALHRILVFFGGSDADNETAKALEGLRLFCHPDIAVDVVVGATNPHCDQIARLCSTLPNARLHRQVNNMAELMGAADLALGAGGITTWERCCLGLPTLVTILADNQIELTHATADHGAIVNLGAAEHLEAADYQHALETLTASRLSRMAQLGAELVDGNGCGRVAQAMLQFEH